MIRKLMIATALLVGTPALAAQPTLSTAKYGNTTVIATPAQIQDANGNGITITTNGQILTIPSINTPALSTPLSGTVSTTGAQTFGPFSADIGRDIWVTMSATGASGTAQIFRSTDGGTTKIALTSAAYIGTNTNLTGTTQAAVDYNWTLTGYTGVVIDEAPFTASDNATYYLTVNLTAGSLTYRLGQ